ncbi:MAG: hypothetical protein ACM3U2_04000 [Deltaproteobacteria bacterium]
MSETPPVPTIEDEIRALVYNWCDRRELGALAGLLPAWLGNNRMTDGWGILRNELRHTYVFQKQLPPEERDILHRLYVQIDTALQKR